jgi:hypothetical protein
MRHVEVGDDVELVLGAVERIQKRLQGGADEVRVRDPPAVVADGRLELLVGDHISGLLLPRAASRPGVKEAIPPIAKAPWRWHSWISSRA